jgi:S1-C subfamily serine protease
VLKTIAIFCQLFLVTGCIGALPALAAHPIKSGSVFRVLSTRNPSSGGTGFVVTFGADLYVLTNKHVCFMPTHDRSFILATNSEKYIGSRVAVSKNADLCLIKPATPLDPALHPPIPINLASINMSAPIYTTGYPYMAGPFDSEGLTLAIEPYYDDMYAKGWAMSLKLTFQCYPGQSGSPVTDSKGALVAVIFGYDHRTLCSAVTADAIRKFLEAAVVSK